MAMYRKSPLPIKKLVHEAFQHTKYQYPWLQNRVIKAWEQLFPQWKDELKKLFIKGKVLHIKLNSLILSKELQSNKDLVLKALQKEIEDLGGSGDALQAIFFL